MIIHPGKFWVEMKVNLDNAEHKTLITTPFGCLLVPFILMVSVAAFIGEIINPKEFLWSYAIICAVREIVCYFLQYYISIVVLNYFFKQYCPNPDRKRIALIIAFSMLPGLLVSIMTNIFPELYPLKIIVLYGFYLFGVGILELLDIPDKDKSRAVSLSILLLIIIFSLLGFLTWRLSETLFTYVT